MISKKPLSLELRHGLGCYEWRCGIKRTRKMSSLFDDIK